MITIIITSFKEQLTIGKAIDSFLNQNIKEKYEIIVSTPDEETINLVKNYSKKNKHVKLFRDPGKGKMLALNLLFKKIKKSDILILTDGDVYVSKNSVNEILKAFKDPKVGCVTGHPVSINEKKNMLGYWSHLLLHGAHKAREKRNNLGQYFTCSGYLFAFRNWVVKEFQTDIPEDAIIPHIFMAKGYKLKYLPEAQVSVKYPDNFRDWNAQKKRVSKAYINLGKVIYEGKKVPKMKSFLNEAIEGTLIALTYPRNLKEVYFTLMLFPARLYIWLYAYYESKIKKQLHKDAWKQIESTKIVK